MIGDLVQSPTRVVVVDDHTLVRQSIVKTVAAEAGFEVVAEASSGSDALKAVERWRPDIVLLDVSLPDADGIRLVSELRRVHSDVRIVFVTMHTDDVTVRGAVGVGADGYVPKSASTDELLRALEAVRSGQTYLAPSVAGRVMQMAGGRPDDRTCGLTARELEIVELIASGRTARQVASELFISVKTVKNHLTNIYAKLGVSSGAQAVAEAWRRGLVRRPPV